MKITLDITAQDFDHLTTNQMKWADNDWRTKKDRFEPLIFGNKLSFSWYFIHWVTTYADYILAAAYLKSIDQAHEAAFDGATGDIAILTDFAGSWGE